MIEYFLVSKENYFSTLLFKKLKTKYNIVLISNNEDLKNKVLELKPIKLFFFHWSYIVPKSIYNTYECINIHTSNLPEGKGGSPLQNQILDNILCSTVNTLKMSDDGLDAGPIYCSKEITLQGNLFDIWLMICNVSYNLIDKILNDNLKPKNQEKINTKINKRNKNNIIPFTNEINLSKIYDFIRMLDEENYPNPYLEIGNFKLEFNRAKFNGENILADVKITKSL
jgi:methionyl-tRNA formyltransferase